MIFNWGSGVKGNLPATAASEATPSTMHIVTAGHVADTAFTLVERQSAVSGPAASSGVPSADASCFAIRRLWVKVKNSAAAEGTFGTILCLRLPCQR